jgi:acetyl-CoA acetyltransferase
MNVKLPARRARLPGIEASFYIVPLKPAYKAELVGHGPANGGAIAIGRPVGGGETRILMTLFYEPGRKGGGKGVTSICGGLALDDRVVVEVEI